MNNVVLALKNLDDDKKKQFLDIIQKFAVDIHNMEEISVDLIREDLLLLLWYGLYGVPYQYGYMYSDIVAKNNAWMQKLHTAFGDNLQNIEFMYDQTSNTYGEYLEVEELLQ